MNEKILVVDDDEVFQEIVFEILHSHNYQILNASNGEEALSILENKKIDIVLSDVMMPIMDGLELVRQLRVEQKSDIPLILMTSHIKSDYVLKAIRYGANDFIGKLFDEKALIQAIKRQLLKVQQYKNKKFTYSHLVKCNLEYVLKPENYLDNQLALYILSDLQKIKSINEKDYNDLLILLDECISNAYLHGTFGFTREERQQTYKDFIESYKKKLLDVDILKKIIHVSLSSEDNYVSFLIKDSGNGFDFEKHLKNEADFLSFDSMGRGVSLINLMADEVVYSDGGRTLFIKKYLT